MVYRHHAAGILKRGGHAVTVYNRTPGKAAELMKAVVANLSEDDIIAISSYLGSLPPQ